MAAKLVAAAAAALAVMSLLIAAPPRAAAAVSCGQVYGALAPCLRYITGSGPLTPPCCGGVSGLNAAAATTADRQAVCGCLKTLAGRFPGMNPAGAAALPGRCGVRLPYPISTSIDCSSVR